MTTASKNSRVMVGFNQAEKELLVSASNKLGVSESSLVASIVRLYMPKLKKTIEEFKEGDQEPLVTLAVRSLLGEKQ